MKTNETGRRARAACRRCSNATSTRINELLAPHGGRSDARRRCTRGWIPYARLRLWPHEYNAVYAAFDRIFDCRGHGWANLQSVHLNLPFAGDDEFGRCMPRFACCCRSCLPSPPARPSSKAALTGMLDYAARSLSAQRARDPLDHRARDPETVSTPRRLRGRDPRPDLPRHRAASIRRAFCGTSG